MTARSPQDQRGVATVELAIIVGLFAALLMGVVELARASQQFATLSASARAAARYAAANLTPDGLAGARCLAVIGQALTSCGAESTARPLLPGLALSQVRISLPADLVDESGTVVQAATPGLSAIQARAADGASSGTLDVLTVTLGPVGARYRFVPLLHGLMPAFEFAPVSVSMALVGN